LPPQAYFLAGFFPPLPKDIGPLETPDLGIMLPLFLVAIILNANLIIKLQINKLPKLKMIKSIQFLSLINSANLPNSS
jgi:hypothetical protein